MNLSQDHKAVLTGRTTTPSAEQGEQPASDAVLGQRHATLTLSPCRKRPGSTEQGQAYGAQLECSGFAVWLEDPTVLGVVAYVLNVGTVRLYLPALPNKTPRVQAHRQDLPAEVIALTSGVSKSLLARQREQAEAQFVRRFATGLRASFGSGNEPAAVVDWYRQKLLPAALKAVPAAQQVNTVLKAGPDPR
jgi:hypothetical protein